MSDTRFDEVKESLVESFGKIKEEGNVLGIEDCALFYTDGGDGFGWKEFWPTEKATKDFRGNTLAKTIGQQWNNRVLSANLDNKNVVKIRDWAIMISDPALQVLSLLVPMKVSHIPEKDEDLEPILMVLRKLHHIYERYTVCTQPSEAIWDFRVTFLLDVNDKRDLDKLDKIRERLAHIYSEISVTTPAAVAFGISLAQLPADKDFQNTVDGDRLTVSGPEWVRIALCSHLFSMRLKDNNMFKNKYLRFQHGSRNEIGGVGVLFNDFEALKEAIQCRLRSTKGENEEKAIEEIKSVLVSNPNAEDLLQYLLNKYREYPGGAGGDKSNEVKFSKLDEWAEKYLNVANDEYYCENGTFWGIGWDSKLLRLMYYRDQELWQIEDKYKKDEDISWLEKVNDSFRAYMNHIENFHLPNKVLVGNVEQSDSNNGNKESRKINRFLKANRRLVLLPKDLWKINKDVMNFYLFWLSPSFSAVETDTHTEYKLLKSFDLTQGLKVFARRFAENENSRVFKLEEQDFSRFLSGTKEDFPCSLILVSGLNGGGKTTTCQALFAEIADGLPRKGEGGWMTGNELEQFMKNPSPWLENKSLTELGANMPLKNHKALTQRFVMLQDEIKRLRAQEKGYHWFIMAAVNHPVLEWPKKIQDIRNSLHDLLMKLVPGAPSDVSIGEALNGLTGLVVDMRKILAIAIMIKEGKICRGTRGFMKAAWEVLKKSDSKVDDKISKIVRYLTMEFRVQGRTENPYERLYEFEKNFEKLKKSSEKSSKEYEISLKELDLEELKNTWNDIWKKLGGNPATPSDFLKKILGKNTASARSVEDLIEAAKKLLGTEEQSDTPKLKGLVFRLARTLFLLQAARAAEEFVDTLTSEDVEIGWLKTISGESIRELSEPFTALTRSSAAYWLWERYRMVLDPDGWIRLEGDDADTQSFLAKDIFNTGETSITFVALFLLAFYLQWRFPAILKSNVAFFDDPLMDLDIPNSRSVLRSIFRVWRVLEMLRKNSDDEDDGHLQFWIFTYEQRGLEAFEDFVSWLPDQRETTMMGDILRVQSRLIDLLDEAIGKIDPTHNRYEKIGYINDLANKLEKPITEKSIGEIREIMEKSALMLREKLKCLGEEKNFDQLLESALLYPKVFPRPLFLTYRITPGKPEKNVWFPIHGLRPVRTPGGLRENSE